MDDGSATRVDLLGPLQVTRDGHPVGPAGSRRRSLLAVLALRPGEVVTVDQIVDALWGEDVPASALNVVQTYVSAWRKALEPDRAARSTRGLLETLGPGYRLHLSPLSSDLLRFTELAEQGRRLGVSGQHGAAAAVLGRALDLWRGEPLADLTGVPFHPAAARHLADRRLDVLEGWAAAVLRSAEPTDLDPVVVALERARAEEPWRERLTELAMWAISRQGRQQTALELYEATRRSLAQELGADPGRALRAMHQRVLRQDPDLAPAPAVRSARRPPQDSFVGRDLEVDAVLDLLESHRVVTLTGPGGTGKTRLAQEVVSRRGGDVVAVELAGLQDASQVAAAIAAQIGLSAVDPLAALLTVLSHRAVLLVLDNLEHLPGAGSTVARLVDGTDHLRVLATSREALGVRAEQQLPVLPLAVPAEDERDVEALAGSDALRLLADRARAVDPTFAVTAGNAADLAAVVRRLDGLPLALEIAAPWLRPLTAPGLLAQLDRLLDVRGRRPGVEARHQSLRATVAWSHDLLSADQQRLLAELSVFRGDPGLDAVEAVCGAGAAVPVVEVLVDLVDRNLVQLAPPVAGRPRYRLLQTVKVFAAERLDASGDRPALEDRHARWFASWATGLAAHSEGPDADAWLAQAVADADELRAAIDHLERTGLAAERLQLVADAMVLWFEAGHEREGERLLDDALASAPPDAPARAIALAYLAWLRGRHDRPRAARHAEEAAGLARSGGDLPVEAFALQTLGDNEDDREAAEAATLRAIEVAQRAGTREVRYGPTASDAVACGAAYNLAALWAHRSIPRALEWQRQAVVLAEREGDRRITAVNSARLGLLHLLAGDVRSAAAPVRRATSLVTHPLTARWEDIVTHAEASLAHHEDRREEAEDLYRALVRTASVGGRLLHVNLGACALTDVLLDAGRLEEAAEALSSAERGLVDGGDAHHVARVQVRTARLRRLTERPRDAADLLDAAMRAFDDESLPPERVVWFVESAVLAAQRGDDEAAAALVRALDEASARTGVAVPPWERRLLDGHAGPDTV